MSPRALPLSFALVLAACNAPPPPTTSATSADASSSAAPSATPAPSSPDYLIGLGLLAPSPSSSAPIPLSPRALRYLEETLRIATLATSAAPRTIVVEDTFVLAAGDASAPLDDAADLARKTMAALYDGPLRHRPTTAATVWVCSSAPRYAQLVNEWALGAPTDGLGLWVPDHGVIVVDTKRGGITSISHEIAHVLLEADMPLAPVWLEEGIASLLELPLFRPDGSVGGKPHFRLQTVRDALGSKTAPEVRLDSLFAMATPESFRAGGKEYLHYAMSREAMRWLDSKRHQLWDFYHTYRRDILVDPTGVASFTSVVGQSPVDATAEWIAWLESDEAAQ